MCGRTFTNEILTIYSGHAATRLKHAAERLNYKQLLERPKRQHADLAGYIALSVFPRWKDWMNWRQSFEGRWEIAPSGLYTDIY